MLEMAERDDSPSWEWQDDSFKLDAESPLAISQSLWDELSRSQADSLSLFSSTPAADIRDQQTLFLTLNDEERHRCDDINLDCGSPSFKRRRMLLFPGTQSCSLDGDPSLRRPALDPFKSYSSHKIEAYDDFVVQHQASPISMQFTDNGLGEESYSSIRDMVEQPTESWVAECLNDTEAQSCDQLTSPIDIRKTSPITSFYSGACLREKSAVDCNVRHCPPTNKSRVSTGRKICSPVKPKVSTPVAYPFALLKPCGAQGDVTLSDINQRIQKPSLRRKHNHLNDELRPTQQSASGLSGKSVVALTKIHTEGNGTITIMRTKG